MRGSWPCLSSPRLGGPAPWCPQRAAWGARATAADCTPGPARSGGTPRSRCAPSLAPASEVTAQPAGGLGVREALVGLEQHHGGHHPGRDRGLAEASAGPTPRCRPGLPRPRRRRSCAPHRARRVCQPVETVSSEAVPPVGHRDRVGPPQLGGHVTVGAAPGRAVPSGRPRNAQNGAAGRAPSVPGRPH
jgi:hypothetical protein